MTGRYRLKAALSCGVLAGMVALDLGVPVWRSVWWPIGDAADIAATTAIAVYSIIGALTGEKA